MPQWLGAEALYNAFVVSLFITSGVGTWYALRRMIFTRKLGNMSPGQVLEVEMVLIAQTETGWLLSPTGEEDDAIWFDKDKCRLSWDGLWLADEDADKGQTYTLEISAAYAIRKRLI